MEHYKLLIDVEFVEARSGKTFESIDPGTGLPIPTNAKAGPAGAVEAQMNEAGQPSHEVVRCGRP